jgi:hypothetical protein
MAQPELPLSVPGFEGPTTVDFAPCPPAVRATEREKSGFPLCCDGTTIPNLKWTEVSVTKMHQD